MNLLSLGIDVAKLKSNVCLIREDGRLRHKVFANTQAGFAQLATWLSVNNVEQVHACLEATGAYGEAPAIKSALLTPQPSSRTPAASCLGQRLTRSMPKIQTRIVKSSGEPSARNY